MRDNEHAAQAFPAKTFDETHAAHVCRQVIDLGRPVAEALAVAFDAQIQAQAFHTRHALVPFRQRLLVRGANARKALVGEMAGQGPSNESPGATDYNQIVLIKLWIFFYQSLLFHNNILFFCAAI